MTPDRVRPARSRHWSRRRCSSSPTPPEAMTSSAVASRSSARPSRSGPPRRPSPWIWVTTTALAPDPSRRASASAMSSPAPSVQPLMDDLAAPDVETERHRLGRRHLLDQLGVLDRGGAHHDPGHAGVGERSGGVGGAHPAAGLHRHRRRRRTPAAISVAVVGLAGAGCVEVDHVDPRHAGGLEAERDLDGVVGVHGLAVEVALHQLHDLAAAQVDGRVQVHQARPSDTRSTKFCMNASPGVRGLLGVELGGVDVAALDRGCHGAAVVARGHDVVARAGRRSCARSTSRSGRRAARTARSGARRRRRSTASGAA